MEKTFQYQQQIFAGLEVEIYNDLLKYDKIFLRCTVYPPVRDSEFDLKSLKLKNYREL